jgi:predicted transcriptional regulator with HTH domain
MIADRIQMDRSSVLGALRGMNNRYSIDYSLLILLLAYEKEELNEGHLRNVYGITKLGIQVAERLLIYSNIIHNTKNNLTQSVPG